jgi:transcriptional regulator CtsR
MEININWTEVICNLLWVIIVMVLIPITKKGLNYILPIIVNFIKNKISSNNWNVIVSMLQDLITSAEINIIGDKVGPQRKEYILNLLTEKGLVNEDNKEIVSNLIDGLCVQLTEQGLINTEQWKQWLEDQKEK